MPGSWEASGDGTCLSENPMEEMSQTLVNHGFSVSGKDYLTSGITGEPLQFYVFMGPIYCQRLKHIVQDKMHSRARDPISSITRQPTEGRSRDGGLRVGRWSATVDFPRNEPSTTGTADDIVGSA